MTLVLIMFTVNYSTFLFFYFCVFFSYFKGETNKKKRDASGHKSMIFMNVIYGTQLIFN